MKSALFEKVTDPSYEITRYINQGHGGNMKRAEICVLNRIGEGVLRECQRAD